MSQDEQQRPDQQIAPAAKYSEHQVGETIQFLNGTDQLQTGEIVYVIAPREIAGESYPLTYATDVGAGFPVMVPFSDVIEDVHQEVSADEYH